MKRLFICLLAAMLLATSALAEPLTLEGTVVAVRSTAVLSTAAGVIRDVSVQAGDHVTAGQAVAALMEKNRLCRSPRHRQDLWRTRRKRGDRHHPQRCGDVPDAGQQIFHFRLHPQCL